MTGARNYLAGTERALYLLSRGTCYFPNCTETVIKFIEGVPISNVQITHIRGALPNSARFDTSMTDAERAAFANLILTCKPHHDLIDRIEPKRYPVELLHEWKVEREGDGFSALGEIVGLTDGRLAEMLEDAFRSHAPRREVTVEISGAIFYDDINAMSIPLNGWRQLVELNPRLSTAQHSVVTTVRNVGHVPASVESISLDFVFDDVSGNQQVCTLGGANDHPRLNPQLPKSLEVGAPALNWLTSLATIQSFLPALLASGEVQIRSSVRLGSGEQISTDTYPVGLIPF
ncbi:hypothetical protein ACPCK3_25945 [Streptomyces griseoincarnatus]